MADFDLGLMFEANAPWCSTGYGIQGRYLAPRLQKLGVRVSYFAFWGLEGGMLDINGIHIYPKLDTMWGQDAIGAHMSHSKSDLLITLMDVWVLDDYGKLARQNDYLWCPWTPIDQTPVPPPVLKTLAGAFRVLPYAQFGVDELTEAGVTNICYIPHGVDTSVFKPQDRQTARAELGLPADKFIIGMVAANKGFPSRKAFPEQVLAFQAFHRTHPDSVLYLHTRQSAAHGGIDFGDLLARLDLKEGEDVLFSDQYSMALGWQAERLAKLYAAFDVLSLTSTGEGFGIPIIEAQACGVPVITAANSAMPELTFSGISVTEQQPMYTPLGGFAMMPYIPAITAAYERMYCLLQDPKERAFMAERAVEGVKPYDWDNVVDVHWRPFLASVQDEIKGRRRAHQWAPIPWLDVSSGEPVSYFPCLDADCAAARVLYPDGESAIEGASMPLAIDGMPLVLADDPTGAVAKIVCREAQESYRLQDLALEPGQWVVEIGAHVGECACYLAKKYPGVRVLALEPHATNFGRLVDNIMANGVEKSVYAVNTAVTGDGRAVNLSGNDEQNTGGWSGYTDATLREVVPSRTLCTLMREWSIDRIALLIVDCEGGEYEILDGLHDAPLHKVDMLVGEFHTGGPLADLGADPMELLEKVRAEMGEDKVRVTLGVLTT